MKRFILLSFLFMGALFYELSGGSDFDPEATRLSAVEARQARDAARKAALDAPFTVPDTPPEEVVARAEPERQSVAPISLALRPFDEVNTEGTRTESRLPAVTTSVPSLVADPATGEQADPSLSLSAFVAQTAPRPSIIFPGSSNRASSADVLDTTDVRVVTGALVNLRSGPGTNFEVVDQLSQNTRVEVLTDTGNGWVELRAVETGVTGWMAEFLLAAN